MNEPKWRPRDQRKKKDQTFSFDQIDIEMIDWLSEYLGVSRSEALRTAVRSFAGQMAALEKKRGRPAKDDAPLGYHPTGEIGGSDF